jgi:hypothetical protein
VPVEGGQQGGGAQVVVSDVVDHVARLPAQADHGRLVADRVDAVQSAVGGRVGQVGVDVLDIVAQVSWRPRMARRRWRRSAPSSRT